MSEKEKSVFETLNDINVNDHIEKKGNLSYLSWVWAWGTLKKLYPDATYTVYEDEKGIPYFTDGRTAWVKTGVTVNGQEYIERLPIMDYKNRSVTLDKVTSMDMNTAIQRSITKAIARHGLGLYIYAGEDLPEDDPDGGVKPKPKKGGPTEAGLGEEFGMEIAATFIENGIDPKFVCQLYGIKTIAEMTEKQMDNAMKNLDKIKAKQGEQHE